MGMEMSINGERPFCIAEKLLLSLNVEAAPWTCSLLAEGSLPKLPEIGLEITINLETR